MTTAVVTGGGHGIGRALCRRLHRDGYQLVVVDLDAAAAAAVAEEVNGDARAVDVGDERAVADLIEGIESDLGPIDLFVSNAGVAYGDGESGAISAEGGVRPVEDRWDACWRINVMAHVYAARALVPRMLGRGGGRLINVASAAGLLSQVGDAAYSATKHAAVGFAEALAIDYGDRGIRVSVVCPQAVATRLVSADEASGMPRGGFAAAAVDGILSPDDVADMIVDGANDGRFLILTHPQVTNYMQRKTADYDGWITAMQRLRAKVLATD